MKNVYLMFLIVLSGILTGIAVCKPEILTGNEFVEKFVVEDTLTIMAVIMTIAIATIATIHIWFNELELRHEKKVFGPARKEINANALLLVWLFVAELIVLILRGYFKGYGTGTAMFDGAAIVVFLSSIITLLDIMNVVRALTPPD